MPLACGPTYQSRYHLLNDKPQKWGPQPQQHTHFELNNCCEGGASSYAVWDISSIPTLFPH